MWNSAAVSPPPVGAVQAPAAAKRWRTEDWIAVVLGFLVLTSVLVLFQWKVVDLRNLVSTFRWATEQQIAAAPPGWIATLDRIAGDAQARKQDNVAALSKAL